ncbi:MAG: tyrosine-type recombinase/integrase [Halanaerobiales bacterium]
MKRITMNKDNDITLQSGWDMFKRYCKIKNLAKHTIRYYSKCYNYFLRFLDDKLDEDKEMKINNINKKMVEEFSLWLDNTYNMKNTTINTRLRGIRAFVYYLMEQKYIEGFKVDLLRSDKAIKETYTDEELERLLEKPDLKKCTFAEYRNWVIVNFLLSTGIRSRSLINIKVNDIDLDDSVVYIRTVKNRKQQVIPLSKTLIKILSDYLIYRNGSDNEYLFCNAYGNKLKSSSLNSAIRRYNLRRKVNKTSIHLFRHTFAKKYILAGGDMFRLQKILGHSSLSVVKEYVNLFSDDLKEDFDRYNPLEQLKQRKGKTIKIKK